MASARGHLITDGEIRAVVSHPVLLITLASRRDDAQPSLFIAQEKQPWTDASQTGAVPEARRRRRRSGYYPRLFAQHTDQTLRLVNPRWLGAEQIRAVVEMSSSGYDDSRVNPALFLGPAAENLPWIEVIADLVEIEVAEVFHAMMLRATLVASLDLGDLIEPKYAQQRA